MNKKGFIEELEKRLDLDKETCIQISEVLEENFFIGRNNSKKTVENLQEQLNLDNETAEKVFDICRDIITDEIKNKLKHPFKDLDK